MKSSKSKGKNNTRPKKFKDQHPAVSPGLAGALVPLLKGGKEQGHTKGVLDAMRKHIRESEGKIGKVGQQCGGK